MEKVLIHFDEEHYKDRSSKLRNAASECQRLVDKISAINGYTLTSTGLINILHGQQELVAAGVKKAVEDDLSRARIASDSIREAAVKGDLQKYYAIVNAFQRPDNSTWPFLSLNDEGKVVVSEKAFTDLKEQCSMYVQTEKGLALRDAHKALVEAINNYNALCSYRFQGDRVFRDIPFNVHTRKFDLIPINFDFVTNNTYNQ